MLTAAELSTALLLVASVASALPLAPLHPLDDPNSFDLVRRAEFDTAIPTGVSLIDYFPHFTSPTSSSVFQAGGDIEISWNNTKPDYADNQLHKSALVILGYLDDNDPSGGYHLDIQHPLGNVSFYAGPGRVSLPLPANLTTRSTYLLTMGSTRNISPLFTIQGTDPVAASSSSASASTPSSSSSSSSASSDVSSAASSSSSASPQIGSKPLTVYFPDGSVTVLGATASPSAATTSAGTANTSLNDIAAAAATPSSSSSSAATASAPASALSSSSSAGAATLAQASAAPAPSASTTRTSAASYSRAHGGMVGLALGTVAALVLAC
ncbi:hypothetical protein JCM10908_001892 [Rhodotorula pacifica]|uniref:uncharacterized protein n=1 Tax=Rhodotorula pacifica TaxID=1495444 RepID=UPI003173AE79